MKEGGKCKRKWGKRECVRERERERKKERETGRERERQNKM